MRTEWHLFRLQRAKWNGKGVAWGMKSGTCAGQAGVVRGKRMVLLIYIPCTHTHTHIFIHIRLGERWLGAKMQSLAEKEIQVYMRELDRGCIR